eukprot:CAMPEP_0177287682 /NCGR_PEP_ID=MMETSP0367-20130122/74276_1 /TAXON_ID=447022 ORGANISM="Scrippsiella hangoei-like, Strain SHHI-4" /NCGR_SAMPLE_ID=MMETSP0367 /ASSEMBLY_ACC=CAM_ASM_000362 /LENGTH=80 /DNA_ID=CAMNT_0018744991 /DNA_START=228 /DNA_END=471 /DNA_ORIENTATION=-
MTLACAYLGSVAEAIGVDGRANRRSPGIHPEAVDGVGTSTLPQHEDSVRPSVLIETCDRLTYMICARMSASARGMAPCET